MFITHLSSSSSLNDFFLDNPSLSHAVSITIPSRFFPRIAKRIDKLYAKTSSIQQEGAEGMDGEGGE